MKIGMSGSPPKEHDLHYQYLGPPPNERYRPPAGSGEWNRPENYFPQARSKWPSEETGGSPPKKEEQHKWLTQEKIEQIEALFKTDEENAKPRKWHMPEYYLDDKSLYKRDCDDF